MSRNEMGRDERGEAHKKECPGKYQLASSCLGRKLLGPRLPG